MECTIKGIAVYYEEVGSGMPLLMLHGFPIDHHHMIYDMEPLFQNRDGWRRIYPDMPGMGQTPGAAWIKNQDQMLDVILEFIDSIVRGERFAIAGTSYGGYLARGVVQQKWTQINGLLLNVPLIDPDDAKSDIPAHKVLVEDSKFIEALGPDEKDLRSFFVVHSLELLEEYRSIVNPAMAAANPELIARIRANFAFSFDVDALPEPLPAPTLILTGRQDSDCGYRDVWRILENYPRGTFAILDRAGHLLGIEQKSLFRAMVSEWLNRVEEYSLTHSN